MNLLQYPDTLLFPRYFNAFFCKKENFVNKNYILVLTFADHIDNIISFCILLQQSIIFFCSILRHFPGQFLLKKAFLYSDYAYLQDLQVIQKIKDLRFTHCISFDKSYPKYRIIKYFR